MSDGLAPRKRRTKQVAALVLLVLTLAGFLQLAGSLPQVPSVASSPPASQGLPGYCPTAASVQAIVDARFPDAKFDPAYQIGTGSCIASPTVVLPDGEQVAVVINDGTISSVTILRTGTMGYLASAFSRWSGYEASDQQNFSVLGLKVPIGQEQIMLASAQRTVPSVQIPSSVSSENGSAQALCCSLSEWVGQTDTPGGLGDLKLIQIGIDMAVGPLSQTLDTSYVGFYEALPGQAIFFNSTQVPCGMPGTGQLYSSSVANVGQYNATYWQYALTFTNDACGGSSYVVYVNYPMNGHYGEIQSEAPVACLLGVVERQEQLPQFSGDRTVSTSLVFNDAGSSQSLSLAQATSRDYVINVNNATSETYNTDIATSGGGFATEWLSSSMSGQTDLC